MPGNETIRGHIEKKKDWIRRARDFQGKKAKLRELRREAEDRNPDEFHFHMVNSQVGLDGVHRDLGESSDDETTETQKLLGDIRDLQYVQHKLSLEQKKIEKLRASLHFSAPSRNTHIIFTDTEREAKRFDPVKHFKTPAEFLGRKFNRPKLSDDDQQPLQLLTDKHQFLAMEKERDHLYEELNKRIEREKELRIVLQKLELKKHLAMSKKSEFKPKLVSKGGPEKPAVYQWTYERKK